MLKGNMIENPEVPGLENNFPQRSSSSPSQSSLSNGEKIDGNLLQESISILPIVTAPLSLPLSTSDDNSLLISSRIPTSNQLSSSSSSVCLWIRTDLDTKQESCPKQLDLHQESSIVTVISDKAKLKSIKRKCESIDRIEDAESVASAQRELTALMKPLKCDLCNAVMNSTPQAKLHYDGKPHQKKVSMFLNQSVKKLKFDDAQVVTMTNSNNWNTHCDVCKTWFTSQVDAAQHYAGKKHIKATTGIQSPAKNNSNQSPIDATGQFGIGVLFQPEYKSTENIDQLSGSIPLLQLVSGFSPGATNYGSALQCDLCGVSANRLEQLEMHRRGTRHQKMMKLNGVMNTVSSVSQNECAVVTPITIDYSICRTPSGSFYCAPCNKSFDSENNFTQHIESKKHKNQINPKLPTNQSLSSTKKKGQN